MNGLGFSHLQELLLHFNKIKWELRKTQHHHHHHTDFKLIEPATKFFFLNKKTQKGMKLISLWLLEKKKDIELIL